MRKSDSYVLVSAIAKWEAETQSLVVPPPMKPECTLPPLHILSKLEPPNARGIFASSSETYITADTRDKSSDIEAEQLKLGRQHHKKESSHTHHSPLSHPVSLSLKEAAEHCI